MSDKVEEDGQPDGQAAESATPESAAQPGDELAQARAQAEENLRGWQRTQADFVNYKRRMQQEREQLEQFAGAEVVRQILPVLDDFERAVANLPESGPEAAWSQGVVAIVRKLEETLTKQGLQPIAAVGKEFDPSEHEAVLNVPVPAEQDGKVTAEVRRGYKLHDRVLRPAQVVVGKDAAAGSQDVSG